MERTIVYAPCAFATDMGKTANDLVIYNNRKFQVVAVIDPCKKGMEAGEALRIGYRGIPVLGTLEEGLKIKADALIIGVAPVGGRLPVEWIEDIKLAIKNKLNVYSGLHDFLSEKKELIETARKSGARIYDLRKPRKELYRIWDGSVLKTECKRILVAGTDCGVGKNVTSIEIYDKLIKEGYKAALIGTGQTMLLLGAKGVVIDSYPLDFAPGVIESLVVNACRRNEYVVVEGQSAVLHPAYGQAALSILYGVSPTHIVLCHEHNRKWRVEFSGLPMPPIERELEALHNLNPYKRSRLAGISLFSRTQSREDWSEIKKKYREKWGVPVLDPLREDVEPIIQEIIK